MPNSEPIKIKTPLKLAFRLVTNMDPKAKVTWETVEGLVTWKDTKGYNVRMALIAGANKKHSEVLYEKGYGEITTRAYRLQSLSNERLVDFLNMEQGGPQARDFANEMNVSSPFYKIDFKNVASSDFE